MPTYPPPPAFTTAAPSVLAQLRHSRAAQLGSVLVLLFLVSFGAPAIAPGEASTVRTITLPIHPDHVDEVSWTDTYGAPRGGGRRHLGVDMMGSKMIPLVAARSGTIRWGRYDNARGSILQIEDDEGWVYHYVHFNNDTPGTDDGRATCRQTFTDRLCDAISGGRFAKGTRVSEGEIVGYMGDGGNAEHTRAHLHFEIEAPGSTPINPTASVDAALEAMSSPSPPPVAAPPEPEPPTGPPAVAAPGESGFVDHLWYQLHGRYPTGAERRAVDDRIAANGVWPTVATAVDDGGNAAIVDQFYLAFFGRHADFAGLRYWVTVLGAGADASDVADWFARSPESANRFGQSDHGAFLDRLYVHVLGRQADPAGRGYWLDQLQRGVVSRGAVVAHFTSTDEARARVRHRRELVGLELLASSGRPSLTDGDVAAWAELRAGTSLADAASSRWP